MKNVRFLISVILTLIVLWSCSNSTLTENTGLNTSMESFLVDNKFERIEDGYIYDGDVFFSKDEVNRLYNESQDQSRGNIAENSSGHRYIWSSSELNNLTYRFTGNLATSNLTDAQVRAAFRQAAGSWNSINRITLREVTAGGVFTVRAVNVTDGYTAISFFPHSSYEHSIRINLRYIDNTYNTYNRMVGLFVHEIGHALGLAHEHQRSDSPNQFGQGTYGEAFGTYDRNSVMSYANRPYTRGISAGDEDLIEYLYPLRLTTPRSQVLGDGSGVHENNALKGDFNGDGKTDLVFVGQNWSGNGLNIRTKFSNGNGTWSSKSQVLGDGSGVHAYPALTGDYNGDGKTDIAFVGQNWSGRGLNIRIKLSNGNGTWTSKSQVLGDGSGVHAYPALTGDFNGDGKTDIAFIGQNWSGRGLNIRTKLSNGNGTWTSKSQVLGDGSGVHEYKALVGDYNNDGKTDIAFVGQNWSGNGLNIRTKFSNGNGTWTSKSQILGDGSGVHRYPALIGDYNGDGKADIAFIGQNWSGRGLNIRTKFSNGNGTWTAKSQVLGDGSGVHTYSVLVGDVNRDGKSDLIFTGQDWHGRGLNIRVKLSSGNGLWSHRYEYLGDGSGVHRYPAIIGDFNKDNRTDIVFIGQNWSGNGLNIRTKFFNGPGI